jgi:hypothetical protein
LPVRWMGRPKGRVAINGAGQFRVVVGALDGSQVLRQVAGAATRGVCTRFLLDAFWSPGPLGHAQRRVERNAGRRLRRPKALNDDSGGVQLQAGNYRRKTGYEQTVYIMPRRRGSLQRCEHGSPLSRSSRRRKSSCCLGRSAFIGVFADDVFECLRRPQAHAVDVHSQPKLERGKREEAKL